MSIKIAKGINPVGKSFHVASMGDGGKLTWHTYKVLRITGASNNVPTINTVVHLEYDFTKRSGNACAPVLQFPIEDFVERVNMENPRILPVEKTDVFWV